ncbi:MAG: 4'-phosphopantetheinyl transferase superfamily protein [Clostridiales bacterium]|nr:4'-phosphopantetheinyl transferase superfamily protein [Clostridiales bacterium]
MELYWYDIREIAASDYFLWFSRMEEEKQKRGSSFKYAADRQRTVVGDALARQALGALTHTAPDSLRFSASALGKPYAVGLNAYFSISHSAHLVLCAADFSPIGADVQEIHPVSRRLMERVCLPEELCWVTAGDSLSSRVTDPAVLSRFFSVWTAKEAWVKYTGTGVSDLSSVNTLHFPADCRLLRLSRDGFPAAICCQNGSTCL